MPTFGLNSGILALTTYCQTHDMERIVERLTTGVFDKAVTVAIDKDKLDIAKTHMGSTNKPLVIKRTISNPRQSSSGPSSQ